MDKDYGFVVVHLPHTSLNIPSEYRKGILLNERRLFGEIRRMTDAFCDELYDAADFRCRIISPVSRLVCDVERFRDDDMEPRAKKGQGLMYTKTYFGRRLREDDKNLRQKILDEIYDPHHARLTEAVEKALRDYGRCLIIDGHSFGSKTIVKPGNILSLPDFDIGTDSFHTPAGLCDVVCEKVRCMGYRPKINTPFAGAITPMKFYKKDYRVISIMFETNRRLYMNEAEMTKSHDFEKTRAVCHALMHCAADYVSAMK